MSPSYGAALLARPDPGDADSLQLLAHLASPDVALKARRTLVLHMRPTRGDSAPPRNHRHSHSGVRAEDELMYTLLCLVNISVFKDI